MTESAFERTTCRLCGGSQLCTALQLEPTPVGDDFVPAGRLGEVQEVFSMDLLLCGDCNHVQLREVVNPDLLYRHCKYTSSVSLGLVDHFHRYADEVIASVVPPAGSLVVEFGSNEGAMLRAFQGRGFRVLGIDPAREIARRATESGIETLPAYFTAELGRSLRERHGPAAVVVGNNVMANIDDLDDLAEAIRAILAPDGVFVFETSYWLDVVQSALIDTIFHEHLSYFAVRPLDAFFRRHGMELIDVQHVETKGGSLRGVVQRQGGPRPMSPSVAAACRAEIEAGLGRLDRYQALAADLERRKRELCSQLDLWRSQGKTLAAYGAAVGLTTMIYQFGLGPYLDCILDDNPVKFHLFSPGLHLPTLPSEFLYERHPDYVVVLAFRYIEPIMKRHAKYLAQGGHFVLPLPELTVLGS